MEREKLLNIELNRGRGLRQVQRAKIQCLTIARSEKPLLFVKSWQGTIFETNFRT